MTFIRLTISGYDADWYLDLDNLESLYDDRKRGEVFIKTKSGDGYWVKESIDAICNMDEFSPTLKSMRERKKEIERESMTPHN